MRFVRPNVPTGSNAAGGHVGTPKNREWLREWIENKGRWVTLMCGHDEDLNDRTLTIIEAFKGTEVLCETCNQFVAVSKSRKLKYPPIPNEPLF